MVLVVMLRLLMVLEQAGVWWRVHGPEQPGAGAAAQPVHAMGGGGRGRQGHR